MVPYTEADTMAALAGSDCEWIGQGWLAQPANAVSSAAFLVVGCWLLVRARKSRNPGVLLSSAAAMIAVGVGSIAYHGPQPDWAGLVHSWSVFGLAAALVLQTFGLLARQASRLVVVAAWRSAGGWMALGVAAYIAGRTGSPVCHPTSLWQLHAAWHVASAVAVGRVVWAYGEGGAPGKSWRPALHRSPS